MELTFEQKLALKLLAQSELQHQFYWTGGTLLAYKYLHHRISEDLDFFSDKEFSFQIIVPWIHHLKSKGHFLDVQTRKIYDRWELLFIGDDKKLRVEFVYFNHEKKTLEERQLWQGVYVDSLSDLAANKTVALIDRNEPKDLFDIYFLIQKAELFPEKLVDLAAKKFGVTFPIDLFWSQSSKLLP